MARAARTPTVTAGLKWAPDKPAKAEAKTIMVRPWAKAIAAIPLRPAPVPTTAAAPAPMNTNAKVPMNSARSLGAIRLDIVLSRDVIDRSPRSRLRQGTLRWLGGRRHCRAAAGPAKRADYSAAIACGLKLMLVMS